MSDTIIKIENLSKQYRIGARERYKTFRETLVDAANTPIQDIQKLFNPQSKIGNRKSDYIWALNDVASEFLRSEGTDIIYWQDTRTSKEHFATNAMRNMQKVK